MTAAQPTVCPLRLRGFSERFFLAEEYLEGLGQFVGPGRARVHFQARHSSRRPIDSTTTSSVSSDVPRSHLVTETAFVRGVSHSFGIGQEDSSRQSLRFRLL